MTPFIYCEEEKILDAHRDALSESKLRIVVTVEAELFTVVAVTGKVH